MEKLRVDSIQHEEGFYFPSRSAEKMVDVVPSLTVGSLLFFIPLYLFGIKGVLDAP